MPRTGDFSTATDQKDPTTGIKIEKDGEAVLLDYLTRLRRPLSLGTVPISDTLLHASSTLSGDDVAMETTDPNNPPRRSKRMIFNRRTTGVVCC